MILATLEDLAFPNYSSREPDEVGSEDMCEHGMNPRAVMTVAERHQGLIVDGGAEFRRTEKILNFFLFRGILMVLDRMGGVAACKI